MWEAWRGLGAKNSLAKYKAAPLRIGGRSARSSNLPNGPTRTFM